MCLRGRLHESSWGHMYFARGTHRCYAICPIFNIPCLSKQITRKNARLNYVLHTTARLAVVQNVTITRPVTTLTFAEMRHTTQDRWFWNKHCKSLTGHQRNQETESICRAECACRHRPRRIPKFPRHHEGLLCHAARRSTWKHCQIIEARWMPKRSLAHLLLAPVEARVLTPW